MKGKAKGKLGIVNLSIIMFMVVFVVSVVFICFARVPETGAYFTHQEQSPQVTIKFESSE